MGTVTSVRKDGPVKKRLFEVGAQLFADRGFDSVTVREICAGASTSANMVHHYFGNKEGLLSAIVDTFTDAVFAYPIRILQKDAQNGEEFITRIELFFEETLEALIEHRFPMLVVQKNQVESATMSNLLAKFVEFLAAAQSKGLVQSNIEPELMSGFLMDRLATQVIYAPEITKYSGYDLIGDDDYRARWVRSNLNLFLYGLVSR